MNSSVKKSAGVTCTKIDKVYSFGRNDGGFFDLPPRVAAMIFRQARPLCHHHTAVAATITFFSKKLGKTKVFPILPMTAVLPAPLTTVGYPIRDTIMVMQPKTCLSLGKLPSTPQISDKKRDE